MDDPFDYRALTVCWFRHGAYHIAESYKICTLGSYTSHAACGARGIAKAIRTTSFREQQSLISSIFENRIHKRKMCKKCIKDLRLHVAVTTAGYDQLQEQIKHAT